MRGEQSSPIDLLKPAGVAELLDVARTRLDGAAEGGWIALVYIGERGGHERLWPNVMIPADTGVTGRFHVFYDGPHYRETLVEHELEIMRGVGVAT
jgi:hypothetical protein